MVYLTCEDTSQVKRYETCLKLAENTTPTQMRRSPFLQDRNLKWIGTV